MAPLSDEENNYIRLALLLKGVSPRAVRTFFDKEFQPSNLHSTFSKNSKILRDLKSQKILNKNQWNLLFPKYGLTNSSNFDVTLMICLIRNLTTVTPPLTGFDALPTQMETTPGSDLARIKWYRNRLAHRESDTIDTVYFNTAWGHISEAVCRLGGQMMKHECQELKVKILDQSNQEIMIGIKQSMREIREMRDIMENRDRHWKEVLKQIVDLTGDEWVGRGDTQRNVIDLTESDDSKTKKRKRWDESDVIVIDIVDLTGDECVGRGDTQRNVIDLTESDDVSRILLFIHFAIIGK
ncbi:uncharacterized protein LOC134711079 [Mytilus trossulus]|uniref:uncharacterized protein LOC134711079 n=1 Tax=Mytilus trossulus TaxID=6551 RepID=UPI003006B8D8